jgi:putative flippase GtrA
LAAANGFVTELAIVNSVVWNDLWTFHADAKRVFVDSRSALCT